MDHEDKDNTLAKSEQDKLLLFLKNLPKDYQINWSSSQFDDKNFTNHFIHLYSPNLQEEFDILSTWTIEEFFTPQFVEDVFALYVDFDSVLEMYLDKEKSSGRPFKAYLKSEENVYEINPHSLSEEEWALYQSTEPWVFEDVTYPPVGKLVETKDFICIEAGVWTPYGISQILNNWAKYHLQRSDLQFVFQDNLQEELYQIAEGFVGDDQVFDFLLSLPPESAAQITEALTILREASQNDSSNQASFQDINIEELDIDIDNL